MYHSLSAHAYLKKIRLEIKGNIVVKLDYAFLAMSLMLLVFNIFRSNNTLSLVFAMIVSFFLPGYVLLRLLKFHSLNSWLEWLVLAFALSIGLTSLIVSLVLPFTAHRSIVISAIYIVMSLFILMKDRIGRSGERLQVYRTSRVNEHYLFDTLLLLWVSLFFIFVISSLYPQMAYLPGLDIVKHFSSSRLLMLAPDAHRSLYPWFHLTCATIYELSSPLMGVFQTGLAYLSLIVVFSFYIMARAYLKDVDRRAPIFATVFFSIFSGFGWLYLIGEKLNTPDLGNHLDMLQASNDASYWDIGYGQGSWIWLWFRPMTIGFTLFFVLLYLLSRKDISKLRFVAIFSFLVVTLGFIHVPELILFNVFILVLTLFMPKMLNLRLKEASLSTLIGSITYLLYMYIWGMFGGIVETPSSDTLLILASTAAISCILTYTSPWRVINSLANREIRFIEVFAGAIALVFMGGLLAWLSSPSMFSVSYVYEIYYIPVIMYPVLLGIVGFFAFHGLAVIAKKYGSNPVIVSVFLFLVTLAFGKLISFLNAEFLDLAYGERRYLPLIFAAASMMASVSFVEQGPKLFRCKKKVLSATILALIVMTGVMSTNLSMEYWKLKTETPIISHYTLDAAEHLSSPDKRDIRTPLLTASDFTRSMAEYIPSAYVVDQYRYPIWESRYPEAPLLILYNKYYPPPYLYLNHQDFDYISSRYGEGYFTRHMLRLLPKAYSNPEVIVFKVPEGAPPSLDSNVVLIIPDDDRDDYLSAYDMLSLGGYDYTVCLSSDIKTITDGETIIMPRDGEDYAKLLENLALQGDKEIIIFNLNGYGPLANLFFESEDQGEDIRATHIKGPEPTLNLPIEVDAAPLIEKDDVKVLARYSDGKKETPFSAEMVKDTGRLVYINVYPIIKASLEEESYHRTMAKFWTMNPMSPILARVIQVAVVNLPTNGNYETWVFEGNTAFFRNASLKGNVVIKSSSFTDFTVNRLANITIVTDREQINITRIKGLYINKTDCTEIYLEEAEIHQGRGFYTELTLVNPTLSISGENVLITLVTNDEETTDITFQNGEIIILGQLTLHARTPSFQVNGEAKFKEMYSLFSLYRWLRSSGQDLNIHGAIEFQLTVSDIYNFASNLKGNGNVAREPPILPWNEYNSIRNMLPWLIISIILAVFGYTFFRKETSGHNNNIKGHIA